MVRLELADWAVMTTALGLILFMGQTTINVVMRHKRRQDRSREWSRPWNNENEDEKMNDEATIESEIQRKGLTAPRLTPADIDAQIVAENTFRVSDALEAIGQPVSEAHKCLTVCVLVLRNGFTLIGESACASPENFDREIGQRIARENAREKIWPLEGYTLRNELSGRTYRGL